MAVLEPYSGDYYLWHYLPSIPAAVIFTLIFLGCTFGLSWRSWKARAKFCIPFIIGTLCKTTSIPNTLKCVLLRSSDANKTRTVEVIGYAARAASHNNTASLMHFSMQNSFTLLGPTLMAATVYMIFGRLARTMHAENHSIVRVSLLTKLFVGGDVLAFVVQGGAAGLMIIQDLAKIGKAMVILGLVIQVLSFGLFMVTSAIFHKRVVNDFTLKASTLDIPWVRIMRVLYLVGLLILIRSVFRLVEYAQGTEGYAMTHEWTLYVFDGVPMAVSAIAMLMWFPSALQQAISAVNPNYVLA
jgi:hypothetical protein